MQTYRAYILDDEKTFKNFQEFFAADDGEAVKVASEMVQAHPIELWEESRLVGTFRPLKRSAA